MIVQNILNALQHSHSDQAAGSIKGKLVDKVANKDSKCLVWNELPEDAENSTDTTDSSGTHIDAGVK